MRQAEYMWLPFPFNQWIRNLKLAWTKLEFHLCHCVTLGKAWTLLQPPLSIGDNYSTFPRVVLRVKWDTVSKEPAPWLALAGAPWFYYNGCRGYLTPLGTAGTVPQVFWLSAQPFILPQSPPCPPGHSLLCRLSLSPSHFSLLPSPPHSPSRRCCKLWGCPCAFSSEIYADSWVVCKSTRAVLKSKFLPYSVGTSDPRNCITGET